MSDTPQSGAGRSRDPQGEPTGPLRGDSEADLGPPHYFGEPEDLTPEDHAAASEGTSGWQAALDAAKPDTSPKPTIIVNEEGVLHSGQPRNIDLSARRAFGGAVSPEFHGYDGTVLAEVSDEAKALVSPRRLNADLFPREGVFVMNYHDPKGKKRWIALTSEEYDLIPRNIRSVGTTTVARTFASNETNPDTKDVYGRVERSLDHALERTGERTGSVRRYLEWELANVKALAKEAATPGMAHMSDLEMRELTAKVWQFTLTKMVRAAAMQRGAGPEELASVTDVLAASLLTGSQQQRVTNWQRVLALAKAYTKARIQLVDSRRADIEQMAS